MLVALVALVIAAPNGSLATVSHHRDKAACERAFEDIAAQVGGFRPRTHLCAETLVPGISEAALADPRTPEGRQDVGSALKTYCEALRRTGQSAPSACVAKP